MTYPRGIRLLLALGLLVLALAVLLLVLVISESALNINARLSDLPTWARLGWWGLVGLGSTTVGWLLWRLLMPGRNGEGKVDNDRAPLTEDEIEARLTKAEDIGADVSAVRAELEQLKARRANGEVHVALFGEVSTGKSALIRALLPGAAALSNVRGGTTRALHRYRWESPAGDALVLADMPGTAEAEGVLDDLARDEALRSHAVIYVCDGDLTRRQWAEFRELRALGKPMVVALSKSDRYSTAELAAIRGRLQERLADDAGVALATVSGGGVRSGVRILPDGREERIEREVPPDVDELALALQRIFDSDMATLNDLRDSAVFVLASRKLDEATAAVRREKADLLVESYTKKAVVGALAAVTPGTDLLIQGWFGTQMIKELTGLYDVKVRKVDTELLLKLVQKHVGRTTTLLLAVAGNALKAFPGVGTLAGGAFHAVAYGMVFRTLGRALISTLETRGELHPVQAAKTFEETLGDNVETSARELARLAFEQLRKKTTSD